MVNNNNIDYYEVLGITDDEKKLTGDAFTDVVKKKFKKLAIKYHPDKWVNGTDEEKKEAEEKFKQINEANSVLSDPQKRERYDLGDTSGFEFPDFSNFNPFGDDDFNPFGGGFSFFGGGRKRKTIEKGDDIQIVVDFTLEEALNGATKEVAYQRTKPCSHCNGTGSSDGKEHVCKYCNGTGQSVQTSRRGNMVMQNITVCPHCHGTGRDSEITSKCSYCNGTGLETENETIKVEIPVGIFNGGAISMRGKGCEPKSKGGVNGNLIITFREKPHPTFTRSGNSLAMTLELDLDEALCGCKKEITGIDGKKIALFIPELTEYGRVFRVAGKGIVDARQGDRVGDLYVTVKYKKLTKISDKQKKLIKEFYDRK